jgi:hypothetical protein
MQRLTRLSAIAVLLLVVLGYRASGQSAPAETPSNIECLDHLEIPVYPPGARSFRFWTTLSVKVLLSDQSTLQTIEIVPAEKAANLNKYFKNSAEKALQNSRFSKTCGGKTITLVFHYELSNDNGSFAFDPPNHFFIRSGGVLVNP